MLIVETIMAVFIGATLVSGLLFFTTSLVPGGSVGHGGWILSALIACMGMSLALLLLIQHKPEPASLVLKVTGIGWSTAFYQGTLLFLRVLQHRIFLYTLAIVTAGLIIYLQQVLDAGFQAALVFSLYCATINFILAWFIFRADHTDCENCRRLSRVLAAILILHGLHLLDFPFFHGHPILGAAGFGLALIINTTINLLLVALVIQKSRSQLEKSEAAAQNSALCDPLTGLLNRAGLQQAFVKKTRSLKQGRQAHALMFLFIDLDSFKHINDQFGHQKGDLVLQTIARRLRANTSAERDETARYGGDEFVVLMEFEQEHIPDSQIRQICHRLLDRIGLPVFADGSYHTITASIGISLYPHDATSLDRLLVLADEAMYRAKQAGASQYCLPTRHHNPCR